MHERPVLAARHPGNGLLREGATKIVRTTPQQHLCALHTELDPDGLDVIDPAVQHDSGQRVHRTGVRCLPSRLKEKTCVSRTR
jgi:hypothetical protein